MTKRIGNIQSKEKEKEIDKLFVVKGKEHLKSKHIYTKEIDDIEAMLEFVKTVPEKFKFLVTPSIWSSSKTNIEIILAMSEWEDPEYKEMLSPAIWTCSPTKVTKILGLKKLMEEKFKKLRSNTIWNHSPEVLNDFLSMTEWENEAYHFLLKEGILNFKREQISSTISLFKEFGIANYITNRCIRSDTSLQRIILEYLKRKNLPLLITDKKGNVKINPIINNNIFKLCKKHLNGEIDLREFGDNLLEDDRFVQTLEQLGGQNGRNIK